MTNTDSDRQRLEQAGEGPKEGGATSQGGPQPVRAVCPRDGRQHPCRHRNQDRLHFMSPPTTVLVDIVLGMNKLLDGS